MPYSRADTTIIFLSALLSAFVISHGGVTAGTITGTVWYLDAPPKLVPVKVSKDQDYCGETLPNETYLIAANGGLKNVVVFLEAAPAAIPDTQKLHTMENDGCRYAPRVMAMQKGERLRIINKDPKLHIPHSYLKGKSVFMLSLPFKNTALEATRKIREAGILKLVCDTHAWMLGYLHVFDHPYFSVSDESGRFTIRNVPPGTYLLSAWHEEAGLLRQEIVVPEHDDLSVAFTYTRDKPQETRSREQ